MLASSSVIFSKLITTNCNNNMIQQKRKSKLLYNKYLHKFYHKFHFSLGDLNKIDFLLQIQCNPLKTVTNLFKEYDTYMP